MFGKIKELRGDELVRGSIVLFIMMNIFNFLNYVYQFIMARFLVPVDYGLFAVLMAVVYVFTVPNEAIQTLVSKITSALNPKQEFGKMKFIFYKTIKKCLKTAAICFVLFIPIAVFLSYFLPGVTFYSLMFTGLVLFGVFTLPVIRGVLQGRKKFKKLGWSMIFEGVFKLIFAIVMVLVGFRIYGAIGGVIIGIIFSFVISLLYIKEVLKAKEEKTSTEHIHAYSTPIIFSIFVIMVMLSLDVIFVKRFFSPEIAGKYAVISLLGKIIFFGTSAIGKAMFPLASEGSESGNDTSRVFRRSLKMVAGLSGIVLLIYLVFPKLVISVLFGSIYSSSSSILLVVALAFTCLSFSNLILLYALSVNKIKRAYSLGIFIIIEILLLVFFNSSLMQFSLAFLASNFLMLLYSIFLLRKKKENKETK